MRTNSYVFLEIIAIHIPSTREYEIFKKCKKLRKFLIKDVENLNYQCQIHCT